MGLQEWMAAILFTIPNVLILKLVLRKMILGIILVQGKNGMKKDTIIGQRERKERVGVEEEKTVEKEWEKEKIKII